MIWEWKGLLPNLHQGIALTINKNFDLKHVVLCKNIWNWSKYSVESHYYWWVMELWLRFRHKAAVKLIDDVIVFHSKRVSWGQIKDQGNAHLLFWCEEIVHSELVLPCQTVIQAFHLNVWRLIVRQNRSDWHGTVFFTMTMHLHAQLSLTRNWQSLLKTNLKMFRTTESLIRQIYQV